MPEEVVQLASPPPPEIEPSYAEVFYSEEFGYSDRMSSDFEVEQLFAPSSAPPPLSPPPSLVELPLAYAEEVSSPEQVDAPCSASRDTGRRPSSCSPCSYPQAYERG